MGIALALAITDTFAAAGRRALLRSLGGAILLLLALWLGASALLAGAHVTGFRWLDATVNVFGSVAALFIAWLLFPATSLLVLGLFVDPFVAAIERAHYPALPPPRRIGVGETLGSGIRLALLSLILNLLVLPLYLLLPLVNVAIFYGLNGYLVGREYFETVALRRMEPADVRTAWSGFRGRFVAAGILIAFLLSVPIVNLAAPLYGAAVMVHIVERLRRRPAGRPA